MTSPCEATIIVVRGPPEEDNCGVNPKQKTNSIPPPRRCLKTMCLLRSAPRAAPPAQCAMPMLYYRWDVGGGGGGGLRTSFFEYPPDSLAVGGHGMSWPLWSASSFPFAVLQFSRYLSARGKRPL